MTLPAEVSAVLAGERRWAVVCRDSLRALEAIPSASVDAVICDPPYSSGGMFRGDRSIDPKTKYVQTSQLESAPTFQGDNRDQRSFMMWCSIWLSECLRVSRHGAPCCVFTDWRQLPVTTDALQVGGYVWRGVVSWDKTEGVRPVMGRFRAQCEFVVWGSRGAMPVARDAEVLPGSFTIPIDRRDKHHIAGKPVALMMELCRIVEGGGLVLDPFAGSATVGVACLRLGLRYLGIEVDPHWAAVATERMEAEAAGLDLAAARTGQVALFAEEAS